MRYYLRLINLVNRRQIDLMFNTEMQLAYFMLGFAFGNNRKPPYVARREDKWIRVCLDENFVIDFPSKKLQDIFRQGYELSSTCNIHELRAGEAPQYLNELSTTQDST